MNPLPPLPGYGSGPGRPDPRRAGASIVAAVLAAALTAPSATAQPLPVLEPLGEPAGCVACTDARAFGAVMGLAILPDGGFVVADRDPPLLRLFAPDGRLETAFGRLGEGPGELRRMGGVAATQGGTLIATDFMGRHLTEFHADGTLVELHPVESTAMAIRSDPAGRWVAWQVADWSTFTGAVHLRASDADAPSIPVPTTEGIVVDDGGRPAAAGLLSAAPGPDGRVAVAHPSVYRVEVVAADGTPIHTITRDVPRTRRTTGELADLADALRQGPGARAGHPEEGASMPEVEPMRPHLGAHGLAYDDRGRLWVRTARGGPGRTVFDLFDDGGAFLGEVELPLFVRMPVIGRGILAGTVRDETTGVDRVHRWRIVG